MSAEIGLVYYKEKDKELKIGNRLEIVTNNATLVINMHKKPHGVRNGKFQHTIPITARTR